MLFRYDLSEPAVQCRSTGLEVCVSNKKVPYSVVNNGRRGHVDGSMNMARASRAFKLKVSPAGFDLLVDCHTRLVRQTRVLLPYGTTLNVAVHYLASLPAVELLDDLTAVRLCDWAGPTPLFLGGPKSLVDVAMTIVDRIARAGPCPSPPELGHIYLLALYRLSRATSADVVQAFEQIRKRSREVNPQSMSECK